MKTRFDSRKWHIWVSIALSIPILIVSVTAVFIAHEHELGLKDIPVEVGWLPGYRSEGVKEKYIEPRAALVSSAGDQYIGTNGGLYRVDDGRPVPVGELAGLQVRAIAESSWGVAVATKGGLWLQRDGRWQRVVDGDAWTVTSRTDGSMIAAFKDKGLIASSDGALWQRDAASMAAVEQMAEHVAVEQVTLGKLVMDLHTGKAFFGKAWEWFWIDLVGLAMTLLTLTGVFMWWRGERRKTALQHAAGSPADAGKVTV
jgi:hypothetical protein